MGPMPARNVISHHPDNVRILVLETDEPHPDTQQEVGSFGEVFNELFLEAGNDHEPKLGVETMMQYIVEPEGGEVPSAADLPEDLHAILITGSEWDAHADHDWIKKLMKLIERMSSELP
jgi:GMP synthase-like glutamine amidotransferase